MKTPADHVRFLVPAVLCYAADIGVTLAGQPAEYWAGDYAAVHEINPLARALLKTHPMLFLAAATAWAAVFTILIVYWRYGAWVAVALTVGHTVGAATWLVRIGPWGWLLAVAYLAAVSQFARRCWRGGRKKR